MRSICYALIALLFASCAQEPVNRSSAGAFDFTRLEGKWVSNNGNNSYIEEWKKGDTNEMTGASSVLYHEDLINIDYPSIIWRDSLCIYTVKSSVPSDSEVVEFPLKSGAVNRLEFENRAYSFPQRFIYQLQNDSSMEILIEGYEEGSFRQVKFEYRKN